MKTKKHNALKKMRGYSRYSITSIDQKIDSEKEENPYDTKPSCIHAQTASTTSLNGEDSPRSRAPPLEALLVERGVIAGIRVAPVPLAQAREAAEMMTMSASFLQAIVEWDGQPVGDGKPGPVAAALEELLWLDMQGLAQEQLDACAVPADRSVVANLEEAAAPELAGAQHVSPIPRL